MRSPLPTFPAVSRRNRPEVADVFRRYFDKYRSDNRLSAEQYKIARHIRYCRTAAMGGHIEACDACGHKRIAYNSCRNRHCPKCQSLVKERWLSARKAELLPCGYFHLVFTLPHLLNPLVLHNRKRCLGLLFAAVNHTLQSFAADTEWRLNGQLGFIAVLHTWSQTLIDHFHLHCLIPAGALSQGGDRWIRARKSYLFRVTSLAACFKKRYLAQLEALYRKGQLALPENWAPGQLEAVLAKAGKTKWIAYAKRPFAGPEQVLEYLSRYTHRVAIANHRLRSIDDNRVSFAYKDRQNGNANKTMTLDAEEFIRRFLLHVLPSGFTKIRYFGFLAHTRKKKAVAHIRRIIDPLLTPPEAKSETTREIMLRITGRDIARCPQCGNGKIVVVARLPSPFYRDTS